MDSLWKKRKQARSSVTPSVLSIQTDASVLESSSSAGSGSTDATAYEPLATSSATTPRHPSVAYPYSSIFHVGGESADTRPQLDRRDSNSQRLSEPLGNLSPVYGKSPTSPTFPEGSKHLSNAPPLHLITQVIPPDQDEELNDGAEMVRTSSRSSRPRSPDQQSIRSVASSSYGDGRETERRKRVDSLGANDAVRKERADDARHSTSTLSIVGELRSPPLSPKKSFTTGRTSSEGPYRGKPGGQTASMMSQSTYNSRDVSQLYPTVASNNRPSSRAEHVSSSAVPLVPRRGSASSTATRISSMFQHDSSNSPALPYGPSPLSSEFSFPRPKTAAAIDELFEELLPRIATTDKAQAEMRALDTDKKWIMVYNDSYVKWKAAREKITHRRVEGRSAPAVGASTGTQGQDGAKTSERTPKAWGKNERPEWYIGRFMDGSITQAQVASLSVCLRTYELR